MRRLLLGIMMCLLLSGTAWGETYVYQIVPDDVGQMAPSGTSTCPVIDLTNKAIDGYFTFQFALIDSNTAASGTSVQVKARVFNVNTAAAIDNTQAIDVLSGTSWDPTSATTHYIQDFSSSVTPCRYMRLEYVAGIAGLTPYGVLLVR